MKRDIPSNVWNTLVCPYCGGTLSNAGDKVMCSSCDSRYVYTESGSIDLRLQRPKIFQHGFEVGTSLDRQSGVRFGVLPTNPRPEVDYSQCDVPYHLTKRVLGYFPKPKSDSSLMLDLGCGNTIHREVAEHAGFEYVGLDYENANAPILGDAHALPFKDNSFEFILCVAVLEHIRFPFVMAKEAHRVLKPNGMIIGTVAFLEPFHANSFYHHTHLGTFNSLQEGGFDVKYICPSEEWTVLRAQAKMSLFPRIPKWLSTMMVMPLQWIHRLCWLVGGYLSSGSTEEIRLNKTTGSFVFIARK